MKDENGMHYVHENPGVWSCFYCWKPYRQVRTQKHKHTHMNSIVVCKQSVNWFCRKLLKWRETKYPGQLLPFWRRRLRPLYICFQVKQPHDCPVRPFNSFLPKQLSNDALLSQESSDSIPPFSSSWPRVWHSGEVLGQKTCPLRNNVLPS